MTYEHSTRPVGTATVELGASRSHLALVTGAGDAISISQHG